MKHISQGFQFAVAVVKEPLGIGKDTVVMHKCKDCQKMYRNSFAEHLPFWVSLNSIAFAQKQAVFWLLIADQWLNQARNKMLSSGWVLWVRHCESRRAAWICLFIKPKEDILYTVSIFRHVSMLADYLHTKLMHQWHLCVQMASNMLSVLCMVMWCVNTVY